MAVTTATAKQTDRNRCCWHLRPCYIFNISIPSFPFPSPCTSVPYPSIPLSLALSPSPSLSISILISPSHIFLNQHVFAKLDSFIHHTHPNRQSILQNINSTIHNLHTRHTERNRHPTSHYSLPHLHVISLSRPAKIPAREKPAPLPRARIKCLASATSNAISDAGATASSVAAHSTHSNRSQTIPTFDH